MPYKLKWYKDLRFKSQSKQTKAPGLIISPYQIPFPDSIPDFANSYMPVTLPLIDLRPRSIIMIRQIILLHKLIPGLYPQSGRIDYSFHKYYIVCL